MTDTDALTGALAASLYFVCEVTGQGDPTWDELVVNMPHRAEMWRKRAAALAPVVAQHVEDLMIPARGLVKSLAEVEERGDLYDAATHRWADLLREQIARAEGGTP